MLVEIGGDGMGGAFAWVEVRWDVRGGGGRGEVPRAFSSAQACEQALVSREEIYTFAPLVTKPSEIILPIPFAPPVTRTTLSCSIVLLFVG